MHATAMLVLVIAVVTVSACVQQSPPMAMSAANIVCQSNGERKNCVVSIVGMLKRVEFLSCIQTKFETVKNCNTSEKNNFIEAVCNLGNQRKGKVFKNHRHGCCILKT